MDTKELVLTYFHAWQNKEWDKMRSCLDQKFKIDAGQIQFTSVDAFIDFCMEGPSWSQVKLLESLFLEKQAALLYEGTTTLGEKIRVGEFLNIENHKIISAKIAISLG